MGRMLRLPFVAASLRGRCALAASLAFVAGGAWAQAAPPRPVLPVPTVVDDAAGEPVPAGVRGGEPAVQRTVIDEKTVRIEEVRVRGQLTRATVESKGALPGYEIVTPGGARDLADGVSPSRGAAGKRVWPLFRF